ncbi:MAG: AI-2E family transporter [Pseudomonadota bacterium]|nr:AI-2E family transporter [Pseudomonadota bacterium]
MHARPPAPLSRVQTSFHTLVMAVMLAVLLGWLLKIGQAILLPVFSAVIVAYVLVTSVQAMQRLPIVGQWPAWLRQALVLTLFTLALLALAAVVAITVDELLAALPRYEANLQRLLGTLTTALGLEHRTDWQSLRATTLDKLDLQALAVSLLGSLGAAAGMVFLIVVYTAFLMSERSGFAHKLATALPGHSAARTQAIIADINQRIGQYLSVKTLVNVILAALSFAVLKLFGVDFALFWALLIGLLHYIPYIGSAVGVALPVLLTLAQFGSLGTTLVIAALLLAIQAVVGNLVEPRMVGKQVNLSPFVVMLALSIWSALWGVAGAILAIPLTSMLAIVLASFVPTRPLAVLLADDVDVYAHELNA